MQDLKKLKILHGTGKLLKKFILEASGRSSAVYGFAVLYNIKKEKLFFDNHLLNSKKFADHF